MKRFPRLSTPVEKLVSVSEIIRATYNKLAKLRNVRLGNFSYDVYRSKKGQAAKFYFLVLADRLIVERIDPSLYLKVLSKYGLFEEKTYLPHPKWLASDKAQIAFRKTLIGSRRRFDTDVEWKAYLNRTERVSPRDISKGIRLSWERLHEIMETWDAKLEDAIFVQFDLLSPWFLAICPEFLRLGGPELLKPEFRKVLKACMRFLLHHRQDFNEAIETYGKFSTRGSSISTGS